MLLVHWLLLLMLMEARWVVDPSTPSILRGDSDLAAARPPLHLLLLRAFCHCHQIEQVRIYAHTQQT